MGIFHIKQYSTCVCVCVCGGCISFLKSKDVSTFSILVFVIICLCNSQRRYSEPNFPRFVNTIFHSYILCLFHHSLIKCSCNYQVYFYGSRIGVCDMCVLLYHLVWESQKKMLRQKRQDQRIVLSSGRKCTL